MYMSARALYGPALTVAIRAAGLPSESYEFNSALHIGLNTDNAEQRWLAGEDIFAQAKRNDSPDPMDAIAIDELFQMAFG
jgi:hypothetical protein